MDNVLQINGLTKVYKRGVLAVNNLNMQIDQGEIYTMLGANGAGKTTTINMLFNFISPTDGSATVKGINVTREPVKAKKNMSYVSENVMLYEDLTAKQNLEYFTRLNGINTQEEFNFQHIFERVGLFADVIDRKIKTFSKGMRQKCGIAIAIAKDADLIVLDEPTSGLDPKSGKEFLTILSDLKKQNKAIFMTTHDIFRAKSISDKIGIMVSGNLVMEMRKEEFGTADLEELYLQYINN